MKKIIKITALVMAAVLMAFSFAACAATENTDTTERETKKYSVTFTANEVPNFVTNQVQKGVMMQDAESGENLGLVTDVLAEDSVSYASQDGKLVVASKMGYQSLIVTVTVEASEDPCGWYIGDTLYGIGHTETMRVGNTEVELTLRSVEALD